MHSRIPVPSRVPGAARPSQPATSGKAAASGSVCVAQSRALASLVPSRLPRPSRQGSSQPKAAEASLPLSPSLVTLPVPRRTVSVSSSSSSSSTTLVSAASSSSSAAFAGRRAARQLRARPWLANSTVKVTPVLAAANSNTITAKKASAPAKSKAAAAIPAAQDPKPAEVAVLCEDALAKHLASLSLLPKPAECGAADTAADAAAPDVAEARSLIAPSMVWELRRDQRARLESSPARGALRARVETSRVVSTPTWEELGVEAAATLGSSWADMDDESSLEEDLGAGPVMAHAGAGVANPAPTWEELGAEVAATMGSCWADLEESGLEEDLEVGPVQAGVDAVTDSRITRVAFVETASVVSFFRDRPATLIAGKSIHQEKLETKDCHTREKMEKRGYKPQPENWGNMYTSNLVY